jgi:hypothetical protein
MSTQARDMTTVRLGLIAFIIVLVGGLSACGTAAGVASAPTFSIQGTWKSVGANGWGQAQPGAIVRFDESQANLYSPRDTYAFTKDGSDYKLEVTGVLGGTSAFKVKVLDSNNIELYSGSKTSPVVVLKRAS